MRTLWVSEKFNSIQGEGPFQGVPATFIRTAYCNLHCTWCDAWYTWDHSRIDVMQDSKKEDTIAVARWVRSQSSGLLVVTGGEPLLQEEALYHVVLMSRKNEVQFETNGTIKPQTALMMMDNVMWVVSPKLQNNGKDPFRRRIRPDVLTWFTKHRATFKFVVTEPRDLDEIGMLNIPKDCPVYLMAQGTTAKELDDKMSWIFKACLERGYFYSDRFHIRAFGDKRGT